MLTWRTLLAAAAITVGPSYLLLAQSNTERPIGILLAAGDISTCGDKNWHKVANRTAELILKAVKDAKDAQPAIPVRVLALGDLAYGKGTKEQFDCYGKRWKGFNDVLLPVPGNHEYLTTDAEPFYKHFKKNPVLGQNKGKGYFAVNFPRADGPWRLIGLNSNFEAAKKYKKDMDAQVDWLTKGLDPVNPANKQGCVLAFWHAPTFTSGRHGHDYKTDPKAPLTDKRPMQTSLRLLHKHGASVVLAGHDHNYEQFKPHDADGNAVADGIRSFVIGTGGAILTEDVYENHLPISEHLYGRTTGIQGVLKIELFESSYRWEFLSIDQDKPLKLTVTKDTCRTRK